MQPTYQLWKSMVYISLYIHLTLGFILVILFLFSFLVNLMVAYKILYDGHPLFLASPLQTHFLPVSPGCHCFILTCLLSIPQTHRYTSTLGPWHELCPWPRKLFLHISPQLMSSPASSPSSDCSFSVRHMLTLLFNTVHYNSLPKHPHPYSLLYTFFFP